MRRKEHEEKGEIGKGKRGLDLDLGFGRNYMNDSARQVKEWREEREGEGMMIEAKVFLFFNEYDFGTWKGELAGESGGREGDGCGGGKERSLEKVADNTRRG